MEMRRNIKMKISRELKKILCNALLLIMLFTLITGMTVIADENNLSIVSGTYFQLGKYNDNPILWKAVVYDNENGILMVSDKILCYKNFDPAYKESGLVRSIIMVQIFGKRQLCGHGLILRN